MEAQVDQIERFGKGAGEGVHEAAFREGVGCKIGGEEREEVGVAGAAMQE